MRPLRGRVEDGREAEDRSLPGRGARSRTAGPVPSTPGAGAGASRTPGRANRSRRLPHAVSRVHSSGRGGIPRAGGSRRRDRDHADGTRTGRRVGRPPAVHESGSAGQAGRRHRRRGSRRRGRAGPGPQWRRTAAPVHGNPQPAQIHRRRQAARPLSTAPSAGARGIRPRSPGIRRGAPAASRDQGADAGSVPEPGRCGALPRRGSHRRDARPSQHRPRLRRGPHRGWLGLRRLQVHRGPHARRPGRRSGRPPTKRAGSWPPSPGRSTMLIASG